MDIKTTNVNLATAQANLDKLCDEVVEQRQITVVRRPDKASVALVPTNELSSWLETLHLLKSPKNAARLLVTFQRALSHGSQA